MDQRDRRNYRVLVALLIILGGLFLMRGPVRAVSGGSDLVHLYVAAALFVEGGDPYSGQACVDRAGEAGYPNPDHVADGSFYPLPTLAALAPLGMMGWPVARLVWLVLNLIACVVLVWSVAQWLAVREPRMRWLVAVLLVVAWGPVATTLSLGQLSLVPPAMICAALVLLDRGRTVWAGVLIGVASVVKPQLGLGFLVLLPFMCAWRALGAGVLTIVAIWLVAFVRVYAAHGISFDYSPIPYSVGNSLMEGGMMDASLNGPFRYQMIDLNPLLHIFLLQPIVTPLAFLIVALLAFAALARLIRLGVRRHLLLAASGVGLLLLLPVYHRYYDAVLLIPLLVLVVNELLRDRRNTTAWVVGLAMLPLFFPIPALLARLVQRGTVPESLADNALWQHVLMQHQSWCLLIATIALVVWTWRLPLPTEASQQQGSDEDKSAV